uniref:Uncharacterized protein n=1 Tax=Anguilla anguilla TaxID=7936 RepID=A0A0E9X133_ANGAN
MLCDIAHYLAGSIILKKGRPWPNRDVDGRLHCLGMLLHSIGTVLRGLMCAKKTLPTRLDHYHQPALLTQGRIDSCCLCQIQTQPSTHCRINQGLSTQGTFFQSLIFQFGPL